MKQFVVEYRPAKAGEPYLFTQKYLKDIKEVKRPAHLAHDDPDKFTAAGGAVIRPVVVGECDPDEGWIIYYKDQ